MTAVMTERCERASVPSMSLSSFGIGRGAIIIAIAGSLCSAAFAQDSSVLSDAANAMIGGWEFSNADHDKICRFAFRGDAVAGGYRLERRQELRQPVSIHQGRCRLESGQLRNIAVA